MHYRGRQISRAGKELKKKNYVVVGAGKRPSYPQCVKGQRHAFSIGVTEPPTQQKIAGLVSRRWWKGAQLGIYRSVCVTGQAAKRGEGGLFCPYRHIRGYCGLP